MPATGGAIFAGNHLSVADEFFLGAVIDRPIAFWAKEDYFTSTGVKGLFFKGLMDGLGAIPVHRAGGRAALSAFDDAIPHLQERRPGLRLPRGHPLARRPALPRPHRRGPAGAGRRRADHPGRHHRHGEGPADRPGAADDQTRRGDDQVRQADRGEPSGTDAASAVHRRP